MCLAKDNIENILTICKKINETFEMLSEDLRKNDLAMQDMLHYIEFEEFNNIIGFAAVQKLKDLRILRRKIKDEIEPLQTMKNMLDVKMLEKIRDRIVLKLNEQSSRRYTPRVIKGGLVKAVNE